jgi:long-chain acyl-CoA synthetase
MANIADLFAQHLKQPRTVLYRHCPDEQWLDVTASELATEIARWQAAFRREGLAAGDRIVVCARNGPAWVAVDLAALGLALVVVPLYVEDNPENVAWCAANAEARLAVVENVRLARGLRKAGADARALARMVILRADEALVPADGAVTVDEFLPPASGGEVEVKALPEATLATICYTSGTSGRPKGVLLSHGNILANVEGCRETRMARTSDRFLSMLPLSHMFERTGGYYLPLSLGARVAYARGIAQIADDLASQSPTVVFAVPRIFERFAARIDKALAESALKRALFDACVNRGYRVARGEVAARPARCDGAAPLVAAPILSKLGGKLRLPVGGAALDPALAKTFGASACRCCRATVSPRHRR